MIRFISVALFLILLAGCSPTLDQNGWIQPVPPIESATLHRIRIEQPDQAKFVGLLALESRKNGIWAILLDATGVPLIKGLVLPDGTLQMDYCVNTLRTTRLPELLGRTIEYIYFTAASPDCPWYDPYRVCFSTDASGNGVTWRKIGPFRFWQVTRIMDEKPAETITLQLNAPSVRVTLQHLAEEALN